MNSSSFLQPGFATFLTPSFSTLSPGSVINHIPTPIGPPTNQPAFPPAFNDSPGPIGMKPVVPFNMAPGGPLMSLDQTFVAPRRPNYGRLGDPIVLKANHFHVKIPGGVIHHYEVVIDPSKCPRRVNR